MSAPAPVLVRGEGLSLRDVVSVALEGRRVSLDGPPGWRERIEASRRLVQETLSAGGKLYGVTTGVGSNASQEIPRGDEGEMQRNLVWFLKSGAGRRLPEPEVRAALLLRLNSLARGVSGIRFEMLQRIERFLNEGIAPHIPELGSIGASGDLIPLAYLAGAIAGVDARFKVDVRGRETPATEALAALGLAPLPFAPKEGLALVNGTSVMTGIAVLCTARARALTAVSLGAHALAVQALNGSVQAFAPFVQEQKPHPGQVRAAAALRALLEGSGMTMEGMKDRFPLPAHSLIQDRYSLRCLPQYTGPILEELDQIARQLEVEVNSANDNPLLDASTGTVYNSGNFLGQYVGMGMDRLRACLGLLAKHLDVQVALLVSPEFNEGLPPSLAGNPGRKVNMGFKSLQIFGNSVMPLITYLGAPLTDRYPTHAEHYNQNINSQGFGSANLARQSTELFSTYLSVPLMMGIQAVDLRCKAMAGHFDAREVLSPATSRLYEAVKSAAGRPPSRERPYLWDDTELDREEQIARISGDLAAGGAIPRSVAGLL